MDWRSLCPEVNEVFIITPPEQVECALLTLFTRVKGDFFLLQAEIFYRSLTNLNSEALDKFFELGPLQQTFLIWCFSFWKMLLLQPFISNCQMIFLSKYSNATTHEKERVRNIWFFPLSWHVLSEMEKALFISSLNWASNCSGQWWRKSFVMNTGNIALTCNTGTSLKYHLILYWCTLVIT